MTVRRMSALPQRFSMKFGLSRAEMTTKNAVQRPVRFSPKAEVRGSNPFGRAIKTESYAQALEEAATWVSNG